MATRKNSYGDSITSVGGRHWRCDHCQAPIVAECDCCEPPRCACRRILPVGATGCMANGNRWRIVDVSDHLRQVYWEFPDGTTAREWWSVTRLLTLQEAA